MVTLVITLLLALAALFKGLAVAVQERRLAARLVPATARVTRRGDMSERRELPSSDADGTAANSRWEHVYTGAWEFSVDGRTYQGEHESRAPVFRAEDMPPARINIWYDRDNPKASRLHPGADTSGARAWFIFAGVIAAVGGLMAAVAGL